MDGSKVAAVFCNYSISFATERLANADIQKLHLATLCRQVPQSLVPFPFRQDRRVEEVRRLQVRLEEQEETNKTLNDVNAVLRRQLESAARTNGKLFTDLRTQAAKEADSSYTRREGKLVSWGGNITCEYDRTGFEVGPPHYVT
jgi:hypothetical protein